MPRTPSKQLGIEDTSAFEFVKEILQGDPTYGINFDRIQWDSKEEQYVMWSSYYAMSDNSGWE